MFLPPEKKAIRPINLGTIHYEREKWPLGLKYSELIQNMATLGRSGAGKTNVTFHIFAQLIEKKYPVRIHGLETNRLSPYPKRSRFRRLVLVWNKLGGLIVQ